MTEHDGKEKKNATKKIKKEAEDDDDTIIIVSKKPIRPKKVEEVEEEEIKIITEEAEEVEEITIPVSKPAPKKKRVKDAVEEEEEGVSVITITKPSYEAEEIEEEEVIEVSRAEEIEAEPSEEGEEVETEEVEEVEGEEEEKVKVTKKPEPKKKAEKEPSKRKKTLVIAVVAIIIIASIFAFIFITRNETPIAKLQVSKSTAMEFEEIEFDGSGSEDKDGEIVEYTWEFSPSKIYSEGKDKAPDGKFDGKTKYHYENDGDYIVKMTVEDDRGETDFIEAQIIIDDLMVAFPEAKIGDQGSYEVDGRVDSINNKGIWSGNQEPLGDATITEVHLTYSGTLDTLVEGTEPQKDGFGESHDTLKSSTIQDLDIQGSVKGTKKTQFGVGTVPFDYGFSGGKLVVTDNSYTDLTTEKTIFSETHSSFDIGSGELSFESEDDLLAYSDLKSGSAELRIEDLQEDRTFEIGDHQTRRIGDVAYSWFVQEAENVNGYAALRIDVDIDKTTKDKNDIKEFSMSIWISNDASMPVKTTIETEIFKDGTTTDMNYTSKLTRDGFTQGDTAIPWGSCTANTPDGHYYERHPDGEFVSWDEEDRIPDIGSGSVSYSFTAQQAMQYAEGNHSGLSSYLQSHPSAYIVNGYYNWTLENPLWNLTYGDKEMTQGYYVIIEKDETDFNILEGSAIDISEPLNSTEDFDLDLSFSSSEGVFRSHEDEDLGKLFDVNGAIRFYDEDISYGVQANMAYPGISISASSNLQRTPYGYFIKKDDDSLSAGVDAMNGQMIYILKHEGDDISMFGGGL